MEYSIYKNARILDTDIKTFSLKEMFFFPKNLRDEINQCDIYYSPFFNIPGSIKIPIFTTIHDIIFPDIKDLVSPLGLFIRMYFFKRAYRLSKKFFTVSEFSKSRIKYHLGNKKPIIVTFSAPLPVFLDFKKLEGFNKTKTLIFIGNIKKNKGLSILLDAFSLLLAENFQYKLIIVGEKDNFRTSDNSVMRKIERMGNENITFTGNISDTDLCDYIAKASLLVQPSLYEGFCLPPLQALVLGTNVLISDIPVLREVYQNFPVNFFNSGDSLDLKEKIVKVLCDNNPISLSPTLINKYNFKDVASTILTNLSGT